MSPELHKVLSDVIKIINEIRHKALNSRILETLCVEMSSQYTHFLFHAKVILTRLFVLREEIKLFFLKQNNQKFQKKLLSDDEWVAKVAYLADVFFLLKELNISFQGQLKDVFTVQGKIDAFRKKLSLWQTHLADGVLQMFTNFDEYMGEKDFNRQVVSIIQQHLQSLTEYFDFYYSSEEDPRPGNMWTIDPSVANIEESKLSMNEKESLIDLSCDNSLKVKFQSSLSRLHFWLCKK